MLKKAFFAIACSFLFENITQANPRCQCEYDGWVGDCNARVEARGNWFKVISDTPQCSRVDWFIDGEPKVTIVTDGAEMEEWLGKSQSPNTTIQSCKVCKDSQLPTADRADETAQDASNQQHQEITKSVFEGTFITNKGDRVQMSVANGSITGTWWSELHPQGHPIFGSVTSETTAWVRLDRPDAWKHALTVTGENTINYQYMWGEGVLTKQ